MKKFFGSALLLCVIVLGVSSGFAGEKVYKLKMATVVSPPHPWIVAAEEMVKQVKDETDGKVQITLQHSAALGSDQSTIDGMRMGVVDMVVGGTSPASTFVPEFAIFSLPFLFDGYDSFNKAMDKESAVFAFFADVIRERGLGFTLLSLCGGGVRDVSNNLRPIVKPDDMKGIKMRVPANPIVSKIWSATGALPSPMAWSEIYSAMQTGVVNCFDSSISGYYGSKYYEVAPFHSLTQHQFMVSYIAISDIAWKKLPEKYREILSKAVEKAGQRVTVVGSEFDKAKLSELQEKGLVKVNEVDAQAWVDLYKPLQDELATNLKGTKNGPKVLKLIRSVQ
ncbi:MAG: hypothetical protein CSA35_01755 [Dethiosulfovibrio peptidovorans]|nr:MAG: hypothetical protein CSA35_01755 [Dethiosulfovibrio peptidovorans]